MNVIYPADYFKPKEVDEMFQIEAQAFKDAGANVFVTGQPVRVVTISIVAGC